MSRKAEPMPHEFDVLATYNAECSRGIVHTPEWDAKMSDLQGAFNRWAAQEHRVEPKPRPLRRLFT